jgi:hypothetical protein
MFDWCRQLLIVWHTFVRALQQLPVHSNSCYLSPPSDMCGTLFLRGICVSAVSGVVTQNCVLAVSWVVTDLRKNGGQDKVFFVGMSGPIC